MQALSLYILVCRLDMTWPRILQTGCSRKLVGYMCMWSCVCVWERERLSDWLIKLYFSMVKILAERPTHLSAVATVLLITKTFIVKYYDRRIKTNTASIIIITITYKTRQWLQRKWKRERKSLCVCRVCVCAGVHACVCMHAHNVNTEIHIQWCVCVSCILVWLSLMLSPFCVCSVSLCWFWGLRQ